MFGGLVFGIYPSWWSAYLQSNTLNNVILYTVIIYLLWISGIKYRRYFNIITYIAVFTLLFELIISKSTFGSLLLTLTSPGVLFYAAVMQPEPMTTPVKKKRQILFGLFVALGSVLLTYMVSNKIIPTVDTSILVLLLGNLIFFKYR